MKTNVSDGLSPGSGGLLAGLTGRRAYRAGMIGTVGTAAFLFVSNGALGLIGSENSDANRLYLGVFAIVFLGALLVRFRPRGMAWVLVAAAVAQALVPVAAFLGGMVSGPVSVFDVVWLTVFFAALWLASAWLFQRAGGDATP